MHTDLQDCVAVAKRARSQLLDGKMSVREVNAITGTNHTIISAYALDLRERMFLAEEDAVRGVNRLASRGIETPVKSSGRGRGAAA